MFDIKDIRSQFPILERSVYNRPLVYLDNAATSQTPRRVVEAIEKSYFETKANVHRGVFSVSQEATELMEATRTRVQKYIGAAAREEIIFTRGTTEAINLVAATYGGTFFHDGDEVIVTVMEHHANIVPWQLLQSRVKITLRPVSLNEKGEVNMDEYRSMFNANTKFVAVCHTSNVLGTINPVKEMISIAHSHGVPVLIDGAQAVAHERIDVQELDADFYAFSSHKMYGPTGVGVLYGKLKHLQAMPPYQGGGEMIDQVRFEKTTFAEPPLRFEAGTPDFVDIAAFSLAMDFLEEVGVENIAAHERELTQYATRRMIEEIPGVRIFGTSEHKCGVISFLLGKAHHYDTGMLLDKLGIAVRTGHHCAQPLMHYLGIEGTVRASFAVYNTREEVDAFITALKRVNDMLS